MSWYETSGRRTERHRFRADLLWTVLLGAPVVMLSPAFAASGVTYEQPGLGAIVLWSALIIAPLPWRRVRPVASTAAVAVVAAAHVAAGLPLILPADIAILVALYSVTVYGPVWAHRTALGTALGGASLLGVVVWRLQDLAAASALTIIGGVLVLAVWAFGLVRRSRHDLLDTLRERARSLEIERDQQAQLATAAERARIAREMHDIVAHSLSVVIAQADGGRYAASSNPEAAGRALEVIAETGRAALADMRRLLGVLRSDDGGPGGNAPRAPQPGMSPGAATASPGSPVLAAGPGAASSSATTPGPAEPRELEAELDDADLGSLLEQARGAGMRVSFVRVGTPRRLPPGAGLTLHRVCQEALTNVRKHGGPEVSVTVVTRWEPTSVELEVSDDGRGAAAAADGEGSATPGYGLLGMGERAALFGAKVTAGPRPGGGWRVRFTMPLPGTTRSEEL